MRAHARPMAQKSPKHTEYRLTFELVVSQGRIADRTRGAIPGAAKTAEALRQQTGLSPTVVGTPAPPRSDDWSTSLPEASDTLTELQAAVRAILERGNTPLIAANTCSASLATLPVVARAHPDITILWIDAHGDFNTPTTTESGYLGGMVLAAACGCWDSGFGDGVDPSKVVIAGARDIDPAEEALLRQAGVRVLSPAQTSPGSILSVIGNGPVWIHVDWDALEPGHVPAAYAIAKGLLPETLRTIFERIPRRQIIGIELAEFEASEDEAENARALAFLLRAISPLIATRQE